MKSLQILSILSYDKVEELKKVLEPTCYYSLLYEFDGHHITFGSKKLFKSKEILADFLILVIKYKNDNQSFPSCCKCECSCNSVNPVFWNDEKIKAHFLSTSHYKCGEIIYRLKEFEVCNFSI